MQIETELSGLFVEACTRLATKPLRDLKSRSLIYLEKPVGKTYVIKRGYVRLAYSDPTGRVLTRMLLGRGSIFGELPFRPRLFVNNEQAITSGMGCVIEMRREEIEIHAQKTSQFQGLLLQTLASQMTAMDRRLQWQLVSPIRKRIATALYDLVCFSGGRCGHGHLVDIRLTHEEFSDLVVAARPVVSEVLAEFKASQIIDYTRGHICLISLDRLENIVEATH